MTEINLNECVFTTKYVIHEHSLITHVLHEHDGDWQFLGNEENLTKNDALLVTIGEIIEFDPSLTPLMNMPLGKQAFRESPEEEWTIYNINNNIYNYFAYGNENPSTVIELKEGTLWSFAKSNPNDYRIDGFILANNRFIERKELESDNWMLIEILPLKYNAQQDEALIDTIPLDDNVALFSQLQQMSRLLGLFIEGEDGFYVGRIADVHSTHFTFVLVNSYLETCSTKNFTYDQVTHIMFDTDYLQSLEMLERENNH